ncbi:MAG: hypothetical protein NWE76_02405 [Candidatus Bathyarchaeota archaeon]|nr:hypothetical protein [Candidatus Bathyarchaeota archaeon]
MEFASFTGILFMHLCHVWIDIVWLTTVSHLAKMGANIAGLRWYRILVGVFGAVLVYSGATFIADSVSGISGIASLPSMHAS